jgi:hypothetical protein
MNEKELRKLISEGLKGGIKKELKEDFEVQDIEGIDELPLSDVDMSDEEKNVFSAMDGGEESFDNFDDLLAKYRKQGGDYEGGYEDDASVSPGYFNENLDIEDIEEMPLSMVDMSDEEKSIFSTMDGEEVADDFVDIKSKFASKDNYEGGYEDDAPVSPGYFNEGRTVQITKEQLQKIIKEGVEQLHRKNLIENRLEQINQELNALSNPQAWEDARNKAQAELEKKTLSWRQITERPNGLVSEGVNEMLNHPDDIKDVSDLPVWKSIMMKIKGVSDEQIQYNIDNDLPLNWKGSKEGYYEKMEPRGDYSGSN